jgi:hypothetical protein
MGKSIIRFFTLGAVLIGIYLFVANGSQTVKIISGLGGTLNESAKTLQGR